MTKRNNASGNENGFKLVSDHNLFTLTSNYITFVYLELSLMQEEVYGVKLKYKGNISPVVLLYFS